MNSASANQNPGSFITVRDLLSAEGGGKAICFKNDHAVRRAFDPAQRSLLSFRRRAAQRTCWKAGSVGSRQDNDTSERVLLTVSTLTTERKRESASRFLCAARFRNDKREGFAMQNAWLTPSAIYLSALQFHAAYCFLS